MAPSDIARIHGVDVRTVQRDLVLIRECGVYPTKSSASGRRRARRAPPGSA
jgi:hypothetical protein